MKNTHHRTFHPHGCKTATQSRRDARPWPATPRRGLLATVMAWAWLSLLPACDDSGKTPPPQILGSSEVELDLRTASVRTNESPIGNLVADVMLDGLQQAGHPDLQVAFMNGGGLRSDRLYPPGDITAAQVDEWLPFVEGHEVLTLSAAQIKAVLERSVATLPANLSEKARKSGWFLHPAGLAYEVDCLGQAQELVFDDQGNVTGISKDGSRVVKITVGQTVLFDAAAAANDPEKTVRVAGPEFMTQGKDGHFGFTQADPGTRTHLPRQAFDLVESVKNHIRQKSPISPKAEGRVTFVQGGCNKAS